MDVVDSRAVPDQEALLREVAARVERVLVAGGAADSAGATVGDELQALYVETPHVGRVGQDLARLRLSLLVEPPSTGPVELRAGIGLGHTTGGGGATAPAQSGTAWWRAREALDQAARRRNGWPRLRWWAEGGDASLAAALIALDTLMENFDEVDRRAALGLLDGRTAAALADELGVVPSTLSARLHTHGVYGFVRAVESFATGEEPGPARHGGGPPAPGEDRGAARHGGGLPAPGEEAGPARHGGDSPATGEEAGPAPQGGDLLATGEARGPASDESRPPSDDGERGAA